MYLENYDKKDVGDHDVKMTRASASRSLKKIHSFKATHAALLNN